MAIFSVSYTEFGHGQVSETGSNNILLRTRRKIGYRNISQEGLIWFCIGLSSPIMNKEDRFKRKESRENPSPAPYCESYTGSRRESVHSD